MQRTLLAVALLAGTTVVAAAQTATPGVTQRQINQQERIDKGVASGQLNEKEAARLQKGQAKVQAKKKAAKADGVVTKAERKELQQAQDKQSARIAKQKHDAQKAK